MQVQFCLARGRVCVRVRARVFISISEKHINWDIFRFLEMYSEAVHLT
jgi:hypothetical protein